MILTIRLERVAKNAPLSPALEVEMDKPTALEKITNSVITEGGLAAIAAAVGTPLAALLPVLSGTLAAGRHQVRVKKALEQIETILMEYSQKLNALTDPQYKLLNEIILTVLQNTENEKIVYLRRAIIGGLEKSDISHTISAQVSRALRDMTAGELAFVVTHSENAIMIGPISGNAEPNVTFIDRNSEEMIYVSGLMGLGILTPAGSTMDDTGRYVFAKFCKTLKELIEKEI